LAAAGAPWSLYSVRNRIFTSVGLVLVLASSSALAKGKPHAAATPAPRAKHSATRPERVSARSTAEHAPKALSVGSPTDGKLENGAHVATSEVLRVSPQYGGADVRYGMPSLVSLVERSAKDVAKKHPGSIMNLGHLSRKGGGELDRHASHESGRDADIGFYIRSTAGKFLMGEHFVAFDANGKAPSWPGAMFDDARNWALVASIVTDSKARVTHIFVATPLRDRLLAYGKKIGAHADIRERASEVLAQPKGALPHDDHFHVRIACPAGMTECIENPTQPKHRALPVARGGEHNGHKTSGATAGKGKTGGKAPQPQKPASEEDALGRLLEPRVEGLDSVFIPTRLEGTVTEPKPEAVPPPIDDVDGQLDKAPDAHE
jgi:penicillin-insensitive murein DD-endopeptidase